MDMISSAPGPARPRGDQDPGPAEQGPRAGAELNPTELDFMRKLSSYLEHASAMAASARRATRTPLCESIGAHLGVDAATVPAVQASFADHRIVDVDLALHELARTDGRLSGITGGDQAQHSCLADLLTNEYVAFSEGPAVFQSRADGPGSTRRVVSTGLWFLTFEGQPLVALVRAADQRYGRMRTEVDVLATDPATVDRFLAQVRELMVERSVLRGKVLSFEPTEYGSSAGATFVERPAVGADDVVLPDGVLDTVSAHVVGIAEHREELRAAGQHLKRGVLLYGPPGTGKTLTVRYLLARTEGTTAIVLTGRSIALISDAAELARTFQPSIVVLEDIDLVAMERDSSPQPLLFEVLDALDGLDGDADVAFVMTTNRAEVLERALAQRPGRVDLAVEVPLPAEPERRRLLALYAQGLGLGEAALDDAAAASEGTTGSFFKELIRRAVLGAAIAGHPVGDADLGEALKGLLASQAALTRRLLGAGAHDGVAFDAGEGEGAGAYASSLDLDEGPPHGSFRSHP